MTGAVFDGPWSTGCEFTPHGSNAGAPGSSLGSESSLIVDLPFASFRLPVDSRGMLEGSTTLPLPPLLTPSTFSELPPPVFCAALRFFLVSARCVTCAFIELTPPLETPCTEPSPLPPPLPL